jgi:hypothetical protein
MPYSGTIVSHDPSLHTGLVLPDGHQQAVGFTEGDLMNWAGNTSLFGQRVSFEVVQTPRGYVAIQMVLLEMESSVRPTLRLQPGSWMAAVVGPLMVALTTHLAMRFLLMPPVFAYALAVNFITLLMFVLVATTPPKGRANPAEAALVLMALCGGAPTLFICMLAIHSRLSSEGLLALLFAFLIMQFFLAQTYSPELLQWRAWWEYYSSFANPSRKVTQ